MHIYMLKYIYIYIYVYIYIYIYIYLYAYIYTYIKRLMHAVKDLDARCGQPCMLQEY